MLRIAYCDDMEKDRERIMISLGQIEDKWGEEFELSSFSSGESLCEDITKNHYDIILLDILMNGIDGIETATRNFDSSNSYMKNINIRIVDDYDNLFIRISNPYNKRLKFKNGHFKITNIDNIFTLEIMLYKEIKLKNSCQ